MKKKFDGMSPDMFHDAMSSTPIPVFTTANNAGKNDVPIMLSKVADDNVLQNELIKIDFDKQNVSARALYSFLAPTERFNFWCKRMFTYGFEENIDYTAVAFYITTNNGKKEDIGDYLLTIDAAKQIAMVQRSEKGKQARNYFINVEKLYLKNLHSNNQTTATPFEKIRNLLVEIEDKMIPQNDYKLLVEKTVALEKKLALHHLKEEYVERTISKKIDKAVKASFREADQFSSRSEFVNALPNPNTAVLLNRLEKELQKTTLEEDLIRKWYRPAERKTENSIFLTATDITDHLESFSKKVIVRNVGRALKKLGFERLYHSIDDKRAKGYFVIHL